MKYIRCPYCGAVNHKQKFCVRCNQNIELNKSKSLSKSIAFLISALVFYIPANIFPILQTSKFAKVEGSTILEGVIQLWNSGDYPVSIIIFVASIMIPIIKFIILIYLIINIGFGWCKGIRQKIKLYHLIEITGPWSLIDVFVVIVLVALIHFKSISIIPGMGATSFALMVIFTILSSISIDERLLGESCE